MKEKYDKLKIEFIEYKIANDISRFFEDVRSEKSDENNNNQVFVHTSEYNHSSFIMSSMESILGLGFEPSCLTWESYLF